MKNQDKAELITEVSKSRGRAKILAINGSPRKSGTFDWESQTPLYMPKTLK